MLSVESSRLERWYQPGLLLLGDAAHVMSPVGEFTIDPDEGASEHRVAIAAGSGITPVLSLLSTTLESEPNSSWTLVYGNRTANSVMKETLSCVVRVLPLVMSPVMLKAESRFISFQYPPILVRIPRLHRADS